jgi:hypothetical protein
MTNTQSWEVAITGSMQNLWFDAVSFIPNVFGAIIIFIVGLMIAVSLGMLITRLMEKLKIDKAADEIGLTHLLEQGDIKTSIPHIIGEIVKWFLILTFLMASADLLGLSKITEFLNSIISFIPNVIVAAIIIALTIVIANFVEHVVTKGGKATKISHNKIIATISKWSILVFGVIAALAQLNIMVELIITIVQGLVIMVALAGGLAFGLGGKDKAAQIINKFVK